MFDSAKNFVIQNGIFIDGLNNAKFYAKKVYSGDCSRSSSSGVRGGLIVNDPRISNYRQIRLGDIQLVDAIEESKYNLDQQDTKRGYQDYRVQVAGENRRRIARFYQGKIARECLKIDFNNISKLRHPRISQIFGICPSESGCVQGLVFHDDVSRLDYVEYAATLKPLHRAIFYMKYMQEYRDSVNYLYKHLWRGKYNDSRAVWTMVRVDQCEAHLHVDDNGRLNVTLSVWDGSHDTVAISYLRWDSIEDSPPTLSQRDMTLIQLPCEGRNITPLQIGFRVVEIINAWHSSLMSMRREKPVPNMGTVGQEMMTLGQLVRVWYSMKTPWTSVVNTAPGYIHIEEKPTFKFTQLPSYFCRMTQLGPLLRFKLRTECITSAILGPWKDVYEREMLIGVYRSDDRLYRSWLAWAPEYRNPCYSLGGAHNYDFQDIGVVSRVDIEVSIQIFVPALNKYMKTNPSTEIYLFFSEPDLNNADGRVIPPTTYWTFDKTGSKRLSEFAASSKGLLPSEITLKPVIRSWHDDFYESLHELYSSYDMKPADVVQLLRLTKAKYYKRGSPFRVPTYMEDLTEITYNRTSETTKKQRAKCLSWIGVTVLEDYEAIRWTWFEHNNSILRRKARRRATMNRSTSFQVDDGWTEITDSDIDLNDPCPVNDIEEKSGFIEDWEDIV